MADTNMIPAEGFVQETETAVNPLPAEGFVQETFTAAAAGVVRLLTLLGAGV